MSVFALICGRLHGEPVTRPTKNGGRVTFFKLRVANGVTLEFWSVTTFCDTAREELDGLPEGSPLSATGEFVVEPWEKDGRRGLNYRLTADRILPLKPRPKPKLKTKTATAEKPPPARAKPSGGQPPSPWDDPEYAGGERDPF
jgi:hypothetical protein